MDVHLCSAHFEKVQGRVLASNPAWTVGKRDFRLAVGRLLNHLAESSLRCQVCSVPVPSWNLKAAYCVCIEHSKQLLNWCQVTSWRPGMDFSHVDIDDFAPRGIKALKASWERTCSRCVCCGKDGADEGTVLTYGHDDQRAPSGTRCDVRLLPGIHRQLPAGELAAEDVWAWVHGHCQSGVGGSTQTRARDRQWQTQDQGLGAGFDARGERGRAREGQGLFPHGREM